MAVVHDSLRGCILGHVSLRPLIARIAHACINPLCDGHCFRALHPPGLEPNEHAMAIADCCTRDRVPLNVLLWTWWPRVPSTGVRTGGTGSIHTVSAKPLVAILAGYSHHRWRLPDSQGIAAEAFVITLLVVVCLLGSPMENPSEDQVAELLVEALSSPRFPISNDAVWGVSGYATLAVAGPPGGVEVEPWLLVSRLGWLFNAQGWTTGLYHNATCSWELARKQITLAGDNGWPSLWVWSPGIGRTVWGTSNHSPPKADGCFVAVVADNVQTPWELQAVLRYSLLEILSYAHAATCSGLAGIEMLADPYIAQGFGAYKRLYVDVMTLDSHRAEELADLARSWAKRREQGTLFLRWAKGVLLESSDPLEYAATCLAHESSDCLMPLAGMLADGNTGSEERKQAGSLVLRALGWHIKALQSLESVAFSHADLEDDECAVLHAPDEEPAAAEDVGLLLKLTESPTTPVRRIAFRKLVGAPLDDTAMGALESGLLDEDPMVAEAALAALEAYRPRTLRGILEQACRNTPYTRIHGDGPFLRLLVLALTRVREAEVLESLSEIGSNPPAVDCKPRAIPSWCAEGIIGLVGQAGWPYLAEMLGSEDEYAREASAIALGRLGVRDTIGNLEAIAFRDSSYIVRCAALGALGRWGNGEAIRELLQFLRWDALEVRSAAALALVEAGEGSITALEEALSLADSHTQETFLSLLERAGTGRARNLLKQLSG